MKRPMRPDSLRELEENQPARGCFCSVSTEQLFFEAAKERAGFTGPETLHVLKAGFPQPFHLVFQWGALAIEIDEAAAIFDQGKDIAIDALDDFWTAGVVNRDGRD